jgi:hypothetical protein
MKLELLEKIAERLDKGVYVQRHGDGNILAWLTKDNAKMYLDDSEQKEYPLALLDLIQRMEARCINVEIHSYQSNYGSNYLVKAENASIRLESYYYEDIDVTATLTEAIAMLFVEVMPTTESVNAERFEALKARAVSTLGSEEAAEKFMNQPHSMLDGHTPLETTETEFWYKAHHILINIEHSLPA